MQRPPFALALKRHCHFGNGRSMALALSLTLGMPAIAQTLTHVPEFTFRGDSDVDYLGSAVSGAGDVNGDGLADFIAGNSAFGFAALGGCNSSGYARLFVSQRLGALGDDDAHAALSSQQ